MDTTEMIGAPFNEEEIPFTFELQLTISDYVTIDCKLSDKKNLIDDIITERKNEIIGIIKHALNLKDVGVKI